MAILALQGAFEEHRQMLQRLGVESTLIRHLSDWETFLGEQPAEEKGLVLPGGESTAMMRILRDQQMLQPLRQSILNGLPVMGTCAGLILLDDAHLQTMDITVKRNAYGRQLGSFHTEGDFLGIGSIPMTFIRAPYITAVGAGVEVLSVVDSHIVAARQENQLVMAFHPELDEDTRLHAYFIQMVRSASPVIAKG